VLIANYQNENSKNSKITKTKFMQVAKNQKKSIFFFFAAKPLAHTKIFAAVKATKNHIKQTLPQSLFT